MSGASNRIENIYSEVPYRVEEITLTVGRFSIIGDLLTPLGEAPHPLVVLVWGSGAAGRHLVGKPSKLITTFIKSGYVVFIEDKPGSGASTGGYSPDKLLSERAMVLAAEIDTLRNHPEIDPGRIGLYGSSQAGYVMMMAIDRGVEVDFLVAVSCPAQDSVAQSAYLVEQQLRCAGYSDQEAHRAAECYIQRDRAQDYSEYLEAARVLNQNPVVRDELDWGEIVSEAEFTPHLEDWDEFYDPFELISRLTIPVLAVFGEKDTQVDPKQGEQAYRQMLENSGQPHSKVITIPGADHNMAPAETGCLKEQFENYKKPGGGPYHPLYLETLGRWLTDLQNS